MPELTQPGGFVSTWLSGQQEHAVGHKALFNVIDGGAHRGEEWTDNGQSGDLARSPWQVLPPSEYTALFQVYSRHPGRPVGRLIAEDDQGRTIAECQVVTGPVEFGDWQRVVLAFQLPAPTRTRIRFHYERGTALWTGLIHLTRSGRRPIYVIGHNRNTPAQADRSLEKGANALEVDISYRDGRLMAAEVPPLPGWKEISEAGAWLRHAQECSDRWAFLYIDCKLHQIPGNDFYTYGTVIARAVAEAGVDPKKCLFSIPDDSAIAIHQAVKEHGFAGSSFGIDGIDNNHPVFSKPGDWAEAAARYQLQVIGMGRAAIEIFKPLPLWWASVEATVLARDAGQPYPRNVIFWSLHEKDGMRKILDLGVDGIIADSEDNLCAVLEEDAYRQFCRKALPSEWDPFHSFGIGG